MNYLGFATWLSIGAAVFCLPYLRWKCPDLPRPIKVTCPNISWSSCLVLQSTGVQPPPHLLHPLVLIPMFFLWLQVNLFFPILYLVMTLAITILPMVAQPVETAIGSARLTFSTHFSSTHKCVTNRHIGTLTGLKFKRLLVFLDIFCASMTGVRFF